MKMRCVGVLAKKCLDAEHEVLLDLEDPAVFSKRVVERDGSNQLMVLEQLQIKVRMYELDSLTTPHKVAAVAVLVGPTSASATFDVCVLRRARSCQQRVYLSFESLVTFFGLTVFKNQPSEWVNRGGPTWEKHLLKLVGPQQVVYGTYQSHRTIHKNTLQFSDRCLPYPSLFTCGLIVLCLRGGCECQQSGGFDCQRNKDSALTLVESLLTVYKSPSLHGQAIILVLDDSWRCTWPRPGPLSTLARCNTIGIHCVDGSVDLSVLLSRFTGHFVLLLFAVCCCCCCSSS